MRQKYFGTTFGFAGDNTVIPDPLQSGGQVSFNQGWTFDYQRDQTTDPAAKPIDRATMNWLFGVVTSQLQQYQQNGTPEFITTTDNGGTPYSYPAGAKVLYSSAGTPPFNTYVSLVAGNTNTPNLADPLGASSGWQLAPNIIATSAQAAAGTDGLTVMTPATVAQQDALRALTAGSSSQVFNVGAATALTHAPQAGQVQQDGLNYAVAGGTANALTATLAPAPTAYTDALRVTLRITSNNTGPVTLNVNGLGVKTVVGAAHSALQGSELVANGFACFRYSTVLGNFVLVWTSGGSEQVGNAVASQQAVALGQLTSGTGLTTPAQFDNSTKMATTAAIWQNRGGFNGVLGINSNTALTVANLGEDIICTSTGTPFTITLPTTTLALGSVSTRITNLSGQTVTVNAPAGGTVAGPFNPGGAATSFTIPNGSTVDVLCTNANQFLVCGDGQIGSSALFAATLASPGSARSANGLLIKWGSWVASATPGNPVAVTFNGAFPNAVLGIATTVNSGSTGAVNSWYDSATVTGFNGHGNLASLTCNYIAVGF